MTSLTFNDFEEYAGNIGHAQVQFTLPRLERPFWAIQHRTFDGLQLQCGSEANGNIAEGAANPDGCVIFAQRTGNRCHANGVRMPEDSLLVSPPSAEFYLASDDPHDWYSIFIPTGLLPDGLFGNPGEAAFPSSRLLCPDRDLVTQLTSIVDRVQKVGNENPEVLLAPRSVADIQEEFLSTARKILGVRSAEAGPLTGRPAVVRDQVIRQVRQRIDASPDDPPSVAQLAVCADVSERTLRTVFLEYYGISPRRYLLLRRLHGAREALRQKSDGATVARVASAFGFWDLGRFAADYRRVFGENPSDTLRRAGGL